MYDNLQQQARGLPRRSMSPSPGTQKRVKLQTVWEQGQRRSTPSLRSPRSFDAEPELLARARGSQKDFIDIKILTILQQNSKGSNKKKLVQVCKLKKKGETFGAQV